VSEGSDGRILVKCYAGCATSAVVDALGLSMSDLFADKPARRGKPEIVATYDYHDADGNVVFQVVRFTPKDFRQRRPDGNGHWVWGLSAGEYAQSQGGDWYRAKPESTGTRRKFDAVTRPLYRLPEVLEAIQLRKNLFLVEGEKDADALRALGLRATTNAMGAAKWSREYSRVLANASAVIIIPDNDEPGRHHAELLRSQLSNAVILELPGLPPKGDVSDWLAAGHTRDELVSLAREALATPAPAPAASSTQPFTALGHNHSRYYFLSHRTGQVASWAPQGFVRANLLELAPLTYWEHAFGGTNGVDWTAASDVLISRCVDAGIYSPERQRGRGAWVDAGRIVLHQGDQLVVDGQELGIHDIESDYVYERGARLRWPHSQPATAADCVPLLHLLTALPWKDASSAILFAGWLAIAPVCGALPWRPHVWLSGPAGSGKSWILEHVVAPILGPLALHVQSSTTEAGLRQSLGSDARPIVFDEAEQEDARSQSSMQRVLELARQASSETGAVIAKGSKDGDAVRFAIRSTFLLSSIGVGLMRRADESRVTCLQLRNPLGGAEQFARVRELAAAAISRERCAAYVARSTQLAGVIRDNCEVFATAASEALRGRRAGDQIGALLAGYWALREDGPATAEAAAHFVSELCLEDYTPDSDSTDERRCLVHILEQRVRVETAGHLVERTLGELVEAASGNFADVPSEVAGATLMRYGLRVAPDGLLVSTSHAALKTLLTGTPWAVNWSQYLVRLEGAAAQRKACRMAGQVTKVTLIPWATVNNETETEVHEAHGLPF